jgi:hypothetical protein
MKAAIIILPIPKLISLPWTLVAPVVVFEANTNVSEGYPASIFRAKV